jgi:hypothetical protein
VILRLVDDSAFAGVSAARAASAVVSEFEVVVESGAVGVGCFEVAADSSWGGAGNVVIVAASTDRISD